ncbi:hypothetical protein HMPREF1092_01971 [Clostridium thermobutyricum]|uniref:Uncharacterized protein n=1 Tax=Clostridium thermobutyricum TaxID=29372 RepID=N9XNH9_9CLOT|nr:hypothetical protein [Clostridium thermobutyricum]ENZ01263.1 hypothetical protein HMPREF1092_01971 [Clostridium thermobutyricum]
MKRYIFTNILNEESSIIKAEDLEDAIIKMVLKHKRMGLGAITFDEINEKYMIRQIKNV